MWSSVPPARPVAYDPGQRVRLELRPPTDHSKLGVSPFSYGAPLERPYTLVVDEQADSGGGTVPA
jgi:hypothetical protein